MMENKVAGLASVVAVFFLLVLQVYGGQKKINYLGKLTDASGNLIEGTKTITFSLYNAGGTKLW